MKKKRNVVWLEEIGIKNVAEVGGKNASLGEMIRTLKSKGVPVPGGFVVTASAYHFFLKEAGLRQFIKDALNGLDAKNLKDLARRGKLIREAIRKAEMPAVLTKEIVRYYVEMEKEYGRNTDVAVRSSATAEDLPSASFAGEHETYLGIRGAENVLNATKASMASLFTDRAISYRVDKGFDHFKVGLSVGIQHMIRSDSGASGVIFTVDTETGFRDIVLINASWGLGEMVVRGQVTPDEFLVFKPLLEKVPNPIISKSLGEKATMMIYSLGTSGIRPLKRIVTPEGKRVKFCLSDEEILELSKWAVIIEEHYTKVRKKWTPMDIEWAKDGPTGKLFIVQARPETIQAGRDFTKMKEYIRKSSGKILAKGISVGSKIAVGKARVILDAKNIGQFKKGEVLVTDMTDPDWEPVMKIASAIVTDKGGRTCFSGDTKVLTDKGFINLREVYEQTNSGAEFLVYSYDYRNRKSCWKKVMSAQRNKLSAIKVSVSQTGRMDDNFLDVTPDHKFFTYDGGELKKMPLGKILKDNKAICLFDYLSQLEQKTNVNSPKLAYLLGAMVTDGSIYLSPGKSVDFRRGQIVFTQKDCEEKRKFISTVNDYFTEIFGRNFTPRLKTAKSEIRGRVITGTATDYRCYDLSIALQLRGLIQSLPMQALSFSEDEALNFLAGAIDGDGSFHNNRIQIYVSKNNVLQGVVLSCLRLGIFPQVTVNRDIYNVQILERMDDILEYSQKIKDKPRQKLLGTKLFAAKQVLGDIIDEVNYKGRIRPYVKNNLFIDGEKIRDYILPMASGSPKKSLGRILDSCLRMQRVKLIKELGVIDVYNIEVEAKDEMDHNYAVFTSRLTPLLVSNSHAAIVSRELGVPAVVGTENATGKLKTGKLVTVDTTGSDGLVFEGALKFDVVEHDLKRIPKTKIKIMMNIATPETAFEKSFLPSAGVGLAREEFIIASEIGVHPNALINYVKLDVELRAQIDKKTRGWKKKTDFYVDNLAFGIAKIAAAFYPKPVIVRFSDFKTNEYRSLLGGAAYEPVEENPMIGWRGASRYYDPKFKEAFGLECKAMKKVREEMGLTNVVPMIPFCRTPEEGRQVLSAMERYGLKREKETLRPFGKTQGRPEGLEGRQAQGNVNLKIYVMCEIPSNILLADEFLKIFDGMSIGSNDLTQLTLGLDRDSGIVSHVANEKDPSVKKLISEIIAKCKKDKKYIGICGQGPGDYPDFMEFLVDEGIESISLNPDTIIKATLAVAKKEKKG